MFHRFGKRLRRTTAEAWWRWIAWLKQPRMVWGYRDSTGEWRPGVRISDTAYLYHPERIRIAEHVFVWHYSILDGTGGIDIEEGVQIGAWVGVFTHSSHLAIRLYGREYSRVPEAEKVGYPIERVRIGAYTFVGAASKIMPGVEIGRGSLISPGTIVQKSVPPFSIVSGSPARVLGDTRMLDEQHLTDPEIRRMWEQWQKLEDGGPRT